MPPSLDTEQTADTKGVGGGAAVQATIRPCRRCQRDPPEHLYSKYEWNKSNVKESTCSSCVIGYQEYKTGEVKRVCLSCDESLVSTDYSFTQWLKGKFQSRCRSCVAPEEAYYKDTIGRRCAKCDIHFASIEFPLQEWTKTDTDTSLCKRCWKDATRLCKTCQVRTTESGNAKHCSACIKIKADYTSNTETKKCSICRRKLASQRGYSLAQWQAANSECRSCEVETISYHTNSRRVCAACGHDTHAIDYALPEWRKGLGMAQCRTCVNGQVAATAATKNAAGANRTETQCTASESTPNQSMIKDKRTCCACKQALSLDAFTKMQRLRKAESSTCMACVYQSIPELATFCFDDRDKSTKEAARGKSDTNTKGECNDDGQQRGNSTTRICTSCAMVLPPSDFTQQQLAVAEPTCRACLKPTLETASAWATTKKAPALGVATTDETPSPTATTIGLSKDLEGSLENVSISRRVLNDGVKAAQVSTIDEFCVAGITGSGTSNSQHRDAVFRICSICNESKCESTEYSLHVLQLVSNPPCVDCYGEARKRHDANRELRDCSQCHKTLRSRSFSLQQWLRVDIDKSRCVRCQGKNVGSALPTSRECIMCWTEQPAQEFDARDNKTAEESWRCKTCMKLARGRHRSGMATGLHTCQACMQDKTSGAFPFDQWFWCPLYSKCSACANVKQPKTKQELRAKKKRVRRPGAARNAMAATQDGNAG